MNRNHPDRDVENVAFEDEELLDAPKPQKTKKPKVVMTLSTAIELATEAHEGQVDQAGNTYIDHPLGVMQILIDRGFQGETDLLIAAVLHDVVEDTDETIKTLRKKGASGRVIRLLELLTHQDGESNEEYWERISLNYYGVQLKDADMTHNTLPERLAQVDPEKRERLTAKYARGKEAIHTYYK